MDTSDKQKMDEYLQPAAILTAAIIQSKGIAHEAEAVAALFWEVKAALQEARPKAGSTRHTPLVT